MNDAENTDTELTPERFANLLLTDQVLVDKYIAKTTREVEKNVQSFRQVGFSSAWIKLAIPSFELKNAIIGKQNTKFVQIPQHWKTLNIDLKDLKEQLGSKVDELIRYNKQKHCFYMNTKAYDILTVGLTQRFAFAMRRSGYFVQPVDYSAEITWR